MSRNTLKMIAAITMLADHIGVVLFPDVIELRYIGRIAMPIFAFFIGEGCLYTRDKKKYFFRLFGLGILCQLVYIIESLITKTDGWGYFNILLTFSVSILVCSSFLYAKENIKEQGRKRIKAVLQLFLLLFVVFSVLIFCEKSKTLVGVSLEFDYGVFGIFLPLFACFTKDKKQKLIAFSPAQILFAYMLYGDRIMFLFALVPLLLLCFYNGKSGKRNLKYFFYAFYPVHLAVIYLISFI